MAHRFRPDLAAWALGGWRVRLAFALALLAAAGGVGRAEPLTQIVVFGDSLSDTGNVSTATGGAMPPAANYFNGRFSNGPNWVDQLAARLGVADPAPSLKGGTDYAYGYAQTGSGTTSTPAPGLNVPNLDTQVSNYLSSNTPKPGQLYTVWAGANDFFTGHYNPSISAANVAEAVQMLAGAGATNALVVNLPALGNTPFGSTLSPTQQQFFNGLSSSFNSALDVALQQVQASDPALTLHTVDAAALLNKIQANPSAYGFTNATDSALFTGHASQADTYLFWDSVHPTTAADALIAEAAAVQYAPEPAALTLMGLGLAGAALGRWRVRREPAH
jgi:phospholipase/lecithinase/hemolysin